MTQMPFNILVAPSGFKEGLDACDVAAAIARGAARAVPDANIAQLPLMDGGEGFTRALVNTTSGSLMTVATSDPLGRPIEAQIGLLGGTQLKTAVLEIASAAGLRLVDPVERDLARASSAGVGHLIRHALNVGARRILIGCGDSGINDGGAGLARVLGARFLDNSGCEIEDGALPLLKLSRIDLSRLDPRLSAVAIEVAVNWKNALTGAQGVSRVYGPQKGADAALVEKLDAALVNFATCVRAAVGRDIAGQPGAGASGGIGGALSGLCGARLIPRFEVVRRYLPFDAHLERAALVITAEGALDRQSASGKIPAEVAARAFAKGVPVLVLAGAIGDGAEATLETGVSAYFSIARRPITLKQSMADAAHLIEGAAEQAVRGFYAGFLAATLQRRPGAPSRSAPSSTTQWKIADNFEI